jgi:hypothetical protein
MLLVALLAWLEAEQRDVIAFLREENRVLKAELGNRRLRLDDDQRVVFHNSADLVQAPFSRRS